MIMDEVFGPPNAAQEEDQADAPTDTPKAVAVKIQTPAPDRLQVVFSQPPSCSAMYRIPGTATRLALELDGD